MNSAASLPRALHLAPLYSTAHLPSMHMAPQREAIDQGKSRPPAENAATTDEPLFLHSAPPATAQALLGAVGGASSPHMDRGPRSTPYPPKAPGCRCCDSGGTSMGSGMNSVDPSGSSRRSTENEGPGRRTEMRSTATGRRVWGSK